MPVDAIEQLFASQAAERKAAVLEFTPDEIRITAENKFDDGIYQLLYDVWKKTSGEYDPKDDKPIVDPRGNTTTKNETKFKYWAMEQYGMTAEEYRGYTFKGTGKTILETAGAYFKVTAPIDAKKGITYLVKKGVTPKNVLKATFGMTDDVIKRESIESILKKETKEVTESFPSRIPQYYTSDLSNVTGKAAKARKRAIEAILKEDFPDLRLTYKPEYSPFIRTGVAQKNAGTQIGKNMFVSRNELRDTIIHEELHHRWWKRGIIDHHPMGTDKEKAFYEIIRRYKKMRGWIK